MDRKSLNVIIGGISKHGIKSATVQYRKYDEAKVNLTAIAGPELANKLIKIIDAESYDLERRTAFIDTTIEAIRSGADYSHCEDIHDLSQVYASNLVSRLLGI